MTGRPGRILPSLVLVATLTACGPDYADLPLPGSGVSGDTYQVSALFDEALNLAQGAQVKVNGVPVGRVQEVTAEDFQAQVTMDIKEGVEIPQDSSARLRYDTPLGELFVQVTPGGSPQHLDDQGSFPVGHTTTAPSVENALASASMLINGGGLGELQVIAHELNTALGGREEQVRAGTRRLHRFLREFNASTGSIDRTLRSLRSVATVLEARQGTIARALREVGPAAEMLGRDTDRVIALLVQAERLARTADRFARAVDEPLLEVMRKLGPVADAVLSTRSEFRQGLDAVIAVADQLQRTVPSETLPLRGHIHVDDTLLNILGGAANPSDAGGSGGEGGSSSEGPLDLLDQPLLPGLDLLGGS